VPETNEWLEATDMSIIRSALTVSVVRGLSNVRDYVHQNRHKLIEEKRMRIIGESSVVSIGSTSIITDASAYSSVESIHQAEPHDEESDEAFSDDENDENDDEL
jgi:kelch-like protein 10